VAFHDFGAVSIHPARSGASPAVPFSAHEAVRSPGRPLATAARAFFEPRFGHDFSQVRIHADARAAAAATAMAARAFTLGDHVVFGAGEYAPHDPSGRRLLAHELTHVAQQRAGVHLEGGVGEVGDAHERQADDVAERIAAGLPVRPLLGGSLRVRATSATPNALQKQDNGKKVAGSPRWRPDPVTFPELDVNPARGATQRMQALGEHAVFESFPTRGAAGFVPDHAFYETLAHVLAYRNDLDARYLYKAVQSPHRQETKVASGRTDGGPGVPWPPFDPAPIDLGNGFALGFSQPETRIPLTPLYYRVHAMKGADLLNQSSGLAAYLLVPSRPDAPGILVFRGTEGAVPDIQADADTAGPGALSFVRHAAQIVDALVELGASGGGTVVTGHSLGGALAQLTAAAFPLLVAEVVTFNSPGISNQALRNFTRGSVPGTSPRVTHYVTRGDLVSTVGQTRLPGKTVMMDSITTRRLGRLYDAGAPLELANLAISQVAQVVDLLASGVAPGSVVIAELLAVLGNTGGLAALVLLGELMKHLHGDTLIPLSAAIGGPGGARTAWRSEPPTEDIGVPEIEKARVSLGNALFAGFSALFDQAIPLLARSAASPLGTLAPPARAIQPTLHALIAALKSMGGLRGVVRRALYADPRTGRITYSLPEVSVTPQKAK